MEPLTSREKDYANNADHFYRGHVFGMIETRLDRMEKDSKDAHTRLEEKVDDLQGNMKYVFGFAAAIGFLSTFIWEWIKSKLHI